VTDGAREARELDKSATLPKREPKPKAIYATRREAELPVL
jgi:hypothetical protein